jgi:hypothetical protein
MDRRRVLRDCGLIAVASVAGCLDTDFETASNGLDEDEDGAEGNEEDEAGPEIETNFETIATDCGTGENRAEITTDGKTVLIEGVIDGRNGCYSAELSRTSIDDDQLRIEVESYDNSEDELCTQCLTDVVYEARISIDSNHVSEIIVEHDGSSVESDDLW